MLEEESKYFDLGDVGRAWDRMAMYRAAESEGARDVIFAFVMASWTG